MIRFDKVSFRYTAETPRVLKDISINVAKGTITVILGPNGVGKTTLLQLILGWHRPETGAIWIKNKKLDAFTNRERGRLMSLVPQSEYIPFEYSLTEYVLLGRLPYLNPLEIPSQPHIELAEESIRQVGLDPNDHRPITILSGGERQLLLLARALCQQPEILILDEPTSHLDLSNKKNISDILLKLRDRGLTVVLTTHEPDFALAVGERLVLLNDGVLVAHGNMEDTFTEELLSKTYSAKITTKTIDGRKAAFWW